MAVARACRQLGVTPIAPAVMCKLAFLVRQKKTPRCYPRRFELGKCSIYFDTDFLNMRSIFSLIASMAVEFDWEVDNA